MSVERFRRIGAPNTVRIAVPGIAEACVPDPDERLHGLLVAAIDECATWCRSGAAPAGPPARLVTS